MPHPTPPHPEPGVPRAAPSPGSCPWPTEAPPRPRLPPPTGPPPCLKVGTPHPEERALGQAGVREPAPRCLRGPTRGPGHLQDVHALQRDHGQLPQPVARQVGVGHGQQRAGEAPLPQEAEPRLGLGESALGAVVLVTEQLLCVCRGRGLRSQGASGQQRGRAGGGPALQSHLSVGGHQDFGLPIQIDVGDQATEDAVKLVTARQEKLVLKAPGQQVPGGPHRGGEAEVRLQRPPPSESLDTR